MKALAQWMKLVDLDADAEHRALGPDGHPPEDLLVARDPRAPVHAQRLLEPGNEEEEAHVRVLEDVLHIVEPPVARTIGDDEAALAEHEHEPGAVPAACETSQSPEALDVASATNGACAIRTRQCSSTGG